MSNTTICVVIVVALGGMLVFGFKTGLMPTYLTGGARRDREPILFWMAAGALLFAIAACVYVAIS